MLVVGDAEPVGAVAIDAERLLCQHAAQIYGVHVSDQHDLPGAGTDEAGLHHLADLFGRIDHPIDTGGIGLDRLDRAAQRLEPPGNQVADFVESLAVTAARLDRNEVAEGSEKGRFLFGRK
jgi:hypothetical protein